MHKMTAKGSVVEVKDSSLLLQEQKGGGGSANFCCVDRMNLTCYGN